ncbi:sister chromatid cohesion protein PDS5 homolog C isoform X2 [Arachis duranensis]|uniref:Sister chromatid cohesion protein PDS5 homolog C isoform X2 n=1 Tax=Arachis duranensis TaxID=130453 RepID=A0A9C6TKK3_ARADU|nr:sister chromatid cohesion protein PDS5 homolog C isoform X2 [Arachis duranensis]
MVQVQDFHGSSTHQSSLASIVNYPPKRDSIKALKVTVCFVITKRMASTNETENLGESDTLMKLKHVGRKLLRCNVPVDELLELLDNLDLILSTVNQLPSEPMQEALVPSMKALISDELLRHTDEDVKISVTSCIAEITRITAPDSPYDDEQMKEIFNLMVAAFDKLSDISGHYYEKVLSILDNVAKIRLCLVMLDLECDNLIIEMFQHFLRIVRSNHLQDVIDSMELIMTLVLDESDEVSADLLRPLLDSLRKENQTISPTSWTLAEKVVTNSSVKLKPYLLRAVESSGRALNEYAQIVTSICQNESESSQHDHSNEYNKEVVQAVENEPDVPKDADEQATTATTQIDAEEQPTTATTQIDAEEQPTTVTTQIDAEEQPTTVTAQIDAEEQPATTTTKIDAAKDTVEQLSDVKKGLKPDITCERSAEIIEETNLNIISAHGSTMDDQIIKESGSKRKPHPDHTKNSKSSDTQANSEAGNLDAVKESRSETHPNTRSIKRGRKPNSLMNAEEGYDHSWIRSGKKTRKLTSSKKNGNSSSVSLLPEGPTSQNDEMQSKPETASEAQASQLEKENTPQPVQSKKTRNVSRDSSPNENPASGKENVPSKHKDTCEEHKVLASETKTDNNTDVSAPSPNPNFPDASRRKRGRPRKKVSTGNQDVDPNCLSKSMKDNSSPQPEGNSSESPNDKLKKESEVRKDSEVKPHTSIRKIKFTMKSDKKNAAAPKSVVVGMEPKVPCEDDQKQKSAVNVEVENREEDKPPSQKEAKKRKKLKSTANKDIDKSSADEELITGFASKTLNGVEKTPQTRLTRRHAKGKESKTVDLVEPLPGSKIMVWWPADKTFYEGVVESYDPVKKRHTVLYTDGETERLNLKKEKWMAASADVQGLALQRLAEASDTTQMNNNEISKLELAKGVKVNSKKSRGRPCAGTSKSKSKSVKSVILSALDKSSSADDAPDHPPSGNTKAKRSKMGSELRKKRKMLEF